MTDSVLVDRPGTQHCPSVTFPTERICEDCSTILSRYNPTRWCRVHEGPARRLNKLFGEFVPRCVILRDVEYESSERPLFRCEGCEHTWPIAWQWISTSRRFCAWCHPPEAVRSEVLAL